MRLERIGFTLFCILAVLTSCREGNDGPDQFDSKKIYITNKLMPWKDVPELIVNDQSYTPDLVGEDLACVEPYGSAEYSIICPAGEAFDGNESSYRVQVPSTQHFIRSGVDPSTIIAVDWLRRSSFRFETASLFNVASYISVRLHAIGGISIVSAQLSSPDGTALSGKAKAFCRERMLKAEGRDGGPVSLEFEEGGIRLSTDPSHPDTLRFAVLPAEYAQGLKLVLKTADGTLIESVIPGISQSISGQTADAGSLEIRDENTLGSLQVSIAGEVRGNMDWGVGTAVNINGSVSYAISEQGGVLTFPVTQAPAYTVAYPAGCGINGTEVAYDIPTVQPYGTDLPGLPPVLYGSGSGDSVSISQRSGILRVRMSTEQGVVRKICSLTLSAEGINGSGSTTVSPDTPFTESTNAASPDNVSFMLAPGSYRDAVLTVRGWDASYPVPQYHSVEDLIQEISYPLGDITISADGIRISTVRAQVIPYDWMLANGTPHLNAVPLNESLAAYINTGYTVPQGSGHAVEYECTMSGAIVDFRTQRAVFGSHDSSNGKAGVWAYNQTEKSGWYSIMGSVAGMETYKQEKGADGKPNGKVFHVDKELADKRVVQMGCDGIVKTSYVWCRWKNLDAGDTQWTDLYEKSDYFKLKSATLRGPSPMILFAYNKAGQVSGPNNDIAIYNFRISYDGARVMDLSPCSVDGVPAMKDHISGKYFFNASPKVQVISNSGCLAPFILGNDE